MIKAVNIGITIMVSKLKVKYPRDRLIATRFSAQWFVILLQ